jgi:hypothetical protein
MRRQFATILAAASTTVLAAAISDANLPLFFVSFGTMCFVLAAAVSDGSLPKASLPLFCIVPGAILLAAFGSMRTLHLADFGLIALLVLGVTYFTLGTALWVRGHYS